MSNTKEISPLQKKIKEDLKEFSPITKRIASIKKICTGLAIEGVDDKVGYAQVDEARKSLKKIRAEVRKTRARLKEDIIAAGKAIDEESNRLIGILNPIYDNLEKKQKAVDDERQRIKEEAARLERERIQKRFSEVIKIGMELTDDEGIEGYAYGDSFVSSDLIMTMPTEEYENLISKATSYIKTAEEEAKRLAEIEAKKREEQRAKEEAEAKRLAEIKEQERKKQEAARMEAEKKAKELEAKQKEYDKKMAELAAREEAIRQQEEIATKKRLAEEEKKREEAFRIKEQARLDKLRPLKAQLLVAINGLKIPDSSFAHKNKEAKGLIEGFEAELRAVQDKYRELVGKL